MNYIDQRAQDIHRAVFSGASIPDGDSDIDLYRIYAVLSFTKGAETTLEDVHDAWSAWIAGLNPEHRSLVPFAELSPSTQELDRPFMDAIRKVSA